MAKAIAGRRFLLFMRISKMQGFFDVEVAPEQFAPLRALAALFVPLRNSENELDKPLRPLQAIRSSAACDPTWYPSRDGSMIQREQCLHAAGVALAGTAAGQLTIDA